MKKSTRSCSTKRHENYVSSHDPFYHATRSQRSSYIMIQYKDALHRGDLQEVTSIPSRATEATTLYRSFLESRRTIFRNYARRWDIFSRDEHGVRATKWWSPPNEPPMTPTVMRRAHDHPRWTRSLTSPIATLLSRPDRPGIATNHAELVIRCVIRALLRSYISGAALSAGVLKLIHLYEIRWWSVHVASPDSR